VKHLASRYLALLASTTPELLALSLVAGLVLGIFPMYGVPTLLCAAAGVVLRLNLPAVQLVNAITSPLQLALLIPFHHLGGRLLRDLHWGGIWDLAARAIAGWSCVSIPLGLLAYFALLGILRRATSRRGCPPAGPEFRTPPDCAIA